MGLDPRALLDAAGVLGGLTGLAALWRTWGERRGAKALKQSQQTQREVDVLKAALEALQASQDRSQAEIVQLHARNVFLSGKADAADTRMGELIERLHAREIESAENRHLLETQGSQLQLLVLERTKLERAHAQDQEQIAQLKQRVSMLEAENLDCREMIVKLEQIIEELRGVKATVETVKTQVENGS